MGSGSVIGMGTAATRSAAGGGSGGGVSSRLTNRERIMYILNCVRMGSEESFRQPDEARRLLRGRVHGIRRPERDGRTGFVALSRRAPISPARTVRIGDGPDGRVHPEEYRKWRNDPNYQRTASEPEGKSGVREHERLISQTFQRLLLSNCTRCDASDVLRSANRRVN